MQTDDASWSSPEPVVGKKRGPGNRVVVVDDDGEGEGEGVGQGNDGAAVPKTKKMAREHKSKAAKRQATEDSDDASGGYDSEEEYADLDDVDYQTMSQQVLRQCESFSSSLRTALSKWEQGALDRDKTTAGAAGGGSTARSNCVQLTKIASSDAGEVLTTEDIAQVCPNLVLKEYQLVGVNWIKLLHSNPPVNGVLADDVSPLSFFPLSPSCLNYNYTDSPRPSLFSLSLPFF